MKALLNRAGLLSLVVLFFCSCSETKSVNNGPIVLGDSATIITEEDPRKLKDLVAEMEPIVPPAENTDTPEGQRAADLQAKDTPIANAPAKEQPKPIAASGMQANFKDVSITFENINGKLSGNPNLERANGAVFTWLSGTINGSKIRISGDVQKVSQRYQTVVLLKSRYGTLLIDGLSTTSDWESLKGGNGIYQIAGLDGRSLEYTDAGPAAIRNAVAKAARRRRMSRRNVEELMRSIKHVRDANQKPFIVELRSVMWKVDGKDAQGRNFSKQIRLDVPL
jgi:hypothetical protein